MKKFTYDSPEGKVYCEYCNNFSDIRESMGDRPPGPSGSWSRLFLYRGENETIKELTASAAKEKPGWRGFGSVGELDDILAFRDTGGEKDLAQLKEMKTAVFVKGSGRAGAVFSNVRGECEKLIRRARAPVGFAPIVPLALMGTPNNMLTLKRRRVRSRVIKIVSDITVSWDVTAKDLERGLTNALYIMAQLNGMGYSLEIYVAVQCPTQHSHRCVGDIKAKYFSEVVMVKKAGEPFNLKKLLSSIGRTAMYRGVLWSWGECILSDGDNFGSHHPIFSERKSSAILKANPLLGENTLTMKAYELSRKKPEDAVREYLAKVADMEAI